MACALGVDLEDQSEEPWRRTGSTSGGSGIAEIPKELDRNSYITESGIESGITPHDRRQVIYMEAQ